MAQFGIQRKAGSMVALLSLLALLALLGYAMVNYAAGTHVQLGYTIYLLSIFVIVAGIVTKEDTIAIGGVMLLNLIVILDIVYYIGVIGPWP